MFVFYLDTRKRLIGLHGLLVGCGEISGNDRLKNSV
jgi:hypothetical protein